MDVEAQRSMYGSLEAHTALMRSDPLKNILRKSSCSPNNRKLHTGVFPEDAPLHFHLGALSMKLHGKEVEGRSRTSVKCGHQRLSIHVLVKVHGLKSNHRGVEGCFWFPKPKPFG